ncbi:glycoside hydrolase family 28 protein [Corticibacterium sp. UT-5YL-CI-8]|nr:glycoside hydrolase family 28 protein [Tianweitania sp. UT-5YL-CI-8]
MAPVLDIQAGIVTARQVAIRILCEGARFHLPRSVAWKLMTGGRLLRQGVTRRSVLSLADLEPLTDYVFEVPEANVSRAFRTACCAGVSDIRAFGASEEASDNAEAIAAAIAATPDGGTVLVPKGLWCSGAVFLKSGITLHLREGAVLKALVDRETLPILPSHHADGRPLGTWEGVPEACYASLVNAIDCVGIAITGAGTIDGGGADGDWWTWPKETRNGARRSRTLFLADCADIVLAGITICNSPSWTVHPVRCRNLRAFGLDISSPPDSPNTDGFNPESCTDVLIEGTRISVGDDCIAIKAGKRVVGQGGMDHLQPTRRVSIRRCLMERGHGGVVIGSEMSGSVSDVEVEACEFSGTDRGLRVKTRRGRGGLVSGIRLDDCVMTGVGTALAVNAFYFCDPDGRSDAVQSRMPASVDETTPEITDISVSNLRIDGLRVALGFFLGLPEAPIRNIRLSNLDVAYDPYATADMPEMASGLSVLRHVGLVEQFADIAQVEGIRFLQSDTFQGAAPAC